MASGAAPPVGLRRVFVANRGEIALRIVRACHALGVEAVVGTSEADRDSTAAQQADRAVCIGPAQASASYLNVGALVTAALGTGCDALHPGYGFLAEDPGLARACEEAGLTFVGPASEVIHAMGNKLVALDRARASGVPALTGSSRILSPEDAERAAAEVGFPLMVKAAAGGGGRGMRIVREPAALRGAVEAAGSEARSAFGDETLYVERYIADARHVEVQVLGDAHGHVIHLGERDCTVQRRHQKLVEEAPAYAVPEDVVRELRDAAVRLAASIGYRSAGTVEFVLDRQTQRFAFLEVNTRVQVEHPVTEMVTGVDIVAEQLRIAGGAPLSLSQADVVLRGHAIECRINAEDASRGFLPSPGRISLWREPEGPGVRIDTHCRSGCTVPPYYDSLLAKLICHGGTREAALERTREALRGFSVEGVATTIPFLEALMRDPRYLAGDVHTRWVEEQLLAGGGSGA